MFDQLGPHSRQVPALLMRCRIFSHEVQEFGMGPWLRPRSSKRAGPRIGVRPVHRLREPRELFLGEGSVRLHGKDGPVGLHEDALGVAAQDEFADL